MEYRVLGKTGLKVSVFGIGSWQLSGPLEVDGSPDGFPDMGVKSVVDLIHHCGDMGINLIDTAEIYGNGEGEKRIGQALKHQRSQWIISSKFGLRVQEHGKREIDSGPATIRRSLEGSLQRLQTDCLDIFLYHCPPHPHHILEGKEVLEQLKSEGKIRFYGISSDKIDEINSLIHHDAVDVILTGQSLIQYPQPILEQVAQKHLGMMTRGAFAGGLLTGRYFQSQPNFSPQDFRYRLKMRWNQYSGYQTLVPANLSMMGLALRYLLDQPLTQTIILGARTRHQYQDAVKVLSQPPLSAQTLDAIRRLNQRQQLRNIPRRALRKLGVPLAY